MFSLSVHNLSFLSNFEFSKSVQYSPRKNVFHFEPLARVHVREGIKLRKQLEFCENLLLFFLLSVHREYWLSHLFYNLSIPRNFEFYKSVSIARGKKITLTTRLRDCHQVNKTTDFAKVYCSFAITSINKKNIK